ncbi:hypothetical protein J2W34_005056 [Variovorax boronicumulans]|uniref:TfpX/TfpZ family type IV pilin accessory protein n=1 Tax=Variovorax boronicumulans TaxID=436515 RepID=UPI002780D5A1|nr:TfpX/TfpZ family type IV pilin accessory protein [Variovorax boronicumulans]MDQ0073248.1 hypothetical protein [Variovorax boronicumulans]
MKIRLRAALKAALIHMLGCLLVAIVVAILVFGIWFPYPYNSIEGGRQLFLIAVAVDAVCGPLLTAVIFSPLKKISELTRDISLVVIIQIAALAYGLHIVASARPVFLAFEHDRFRVVSAVEINTHDLPNALPEFQNLSLKGPRLIGVRVPKPGDDDYLSSVEQSLNGVETSLRPKLWRPYSEQEELVKNKLQSLPSLKSRRHENLLAIDAAVGKLSLPEASIGYLPVVGRTRSGWIALVSRNDARVLGFVEVDGF